jgi:hypothetical protein
MLFDFQLLAAALAVAPLALGHTWIEQLRNVNDKGQYVGEYGYPRGMVSKTDIGYSGLSMNFEIPAYQGKLFIDEDTMLCHKKQREQKQSSDKYPRLQAVPGGFIAMRYMENGHITKPDNQKGKPAKAGTVFVYGTTQPKDAEKLADVLRWTQDGKGGDGRGTLITMNNFDDGRCYETNETPEFKDRSKAVPNYAMGQPEKGPGNMPLFCETNVQLPKTAAMGKPYTFYWVWQWNTAPGGIDPGLPKGKDEYYSTCIDVDVASADVALAADAEPKFALGQQDGMAKAVADFASRTAIMTDALKGEVGPIFSGKQTPVSSSPGGAPTQKPSASAPLSQPPAPSSKTPALSSGAPVPTSKVSLISGQPAIPTITKRPGAAPSSQPSNGDVTITDTVFVTMTAPIASTPAASSKRTITSVKSQALPAASQSPSSMITSRRTATPVKSQTPAAGVTPPASKVPAAPSTGPQSSAAAASSQLPGFNMRNPNGAKFRGRFT